MKQKAGIKDRLVYVSLHSVFTVLSLLPLGVLYVLADFVAWLAHSVVGYRRGVVRANIQSSFPEKGTEWVRREEKAFYRWLADYFVETVKLTTMSRGEMERRMKFEGLELIDADLKAGRSVTLYLGHYCNWEWVSSIPLHMTADAEFGQIYHPLENRGADRLFLKLRKRFGATNIAMNDTLPVLRSWQQQGRPSVTGYIADQLPNFNGIHLWLDFLHHDTAVFTGPERMARALHTSAYYLDLSRPKRGYYLGRVRRLTADASQLPKFELTRSYFSCLQDTIQAAPPYWLWSHRRWKRTRQDFMQVYGESATRQMNRI